MTGVNRPVDPEFIVNTITLQIDKWDAIANQIRVLSSIAPSTLFARALHTDRRRCSDKDEDDEYKRRRLMYKIDNYIMHTIKPIMTELDDDYIKVVKRGLFDNSGGENSIISVIGRCSYATVRHGVERYLEAYKRYYTSLNNDEHEDGDSAVDDSCGDPDIDYYRTMVFYSDQLYHPSDEGCMSTVILMSDLMRRIHTECLNQHVTDALVCDDDCEGDYSDAGGDKRIEDPYNILNCQSRDKAFNYNITRTDDFFRYIAECNSYPTVPEDIAGVLLPTCTQEREDEDRGLLEPGPNSSSHITDVVSERVCSSCKLHFITIGQTDTVEQRARHRCECVLKLESKESAYAKCDFGSSTAVCNRNRRENPDQYTLDKFNSDQVTRATMLGRMIYATTKYGGCECDNHKLIFKAASARQKMHFDNISKFRNSCDISESSTVTLASSR